MEDGRLINLKNANKEELSKFWQLYEAGNVQALRTLCYIDQAAANGSEEAQQVVAHIKKTSDIDTEKWQSLTAAASATLYEQFTDPVIGTITRDEVKEEVTFGRFLEMIQAAPNDDNANNEVVVILDAIIKHASKDPELKDHPDAANALEELKKIREYLTKDTTVGALERFLTAESAFMVTPLPGGLEFLTRINDDAKGGTVTRTFNNGKYKVTYTGRLGLDEQKISILIRNYFADNNYYKETKNFDTWVEVPVSLTMEYLGKKDTPANRKQFRTRLRKMLVDIAHQSLSIMDDKGHYQAADFGTGEREVNPRTDCFRFKISDTFARLMSGAPQGQVYNKALRLGTQKNPLPFYLCQKLLNTYFRDGNRSQGTNTILSVKKLLEYCGDMIPTFETIQATDPGHWVDRIRDKLEKALNEIQDEGIFAWEYCKKGLSPVKPQERRTRDYHKWSKLYITFRLIPDEPDQANRLRHKAERIEAAKHRQEVIDAKHIIKADKIRKKAAEKTKGDK